MKSSIFKKLILLSLLAYGHASYAESLKTVRIGSPDLTAGQKHAGGGVVDVLYNKKWLEQELAKQNVKVQWYFFKGAGPAINEALANNQLDFAFLGDLPPIIGKANGLDTQLLVPTARGITNYLAVRSDLSIKNFAELKGKRVGLLRGTADELSFVSALNSQGLKLSDVRVVNLDFNAVNAALAAKKIDASWGPSRFFSLRDKHIVNLPVSSRQLKGAGSTQGVFLGRQSFIRQHPNETQQVVTQVVKGLNWLSNEQNRVSQVALFFTQSGYPASIYAQELNGVNLKFLYSPLFDGYYTQQLQQKITLATQQGLIRKNVDVKSWINPSFVNQALEQSNLKTYWKPTQQYEYLKSVK